MLRVGVWNISLSPPSSRTLGFDMLLFFKNIITKKIGIEIFSGGDDNELT